MVCRNEKLKMSRYLPWPPKYIKISPLIFHLWKLKESSLETASCVLRFFKTIGCFSLRKISLKSRQFVLFFRLIFSTAFFNFVKKNWIFWNKSLTKFSTFSAKLKKAVGKICLKKMTNLHACQFMLCWKPRHV